MKRFRRLIDIVNTPLVWLGEAITALICLHVTIDIAANLIRAPLEGTEDFVARWYMVAVVFLPLGYIQRHNLHIKAEVIVARQSPRVQALLSIVSQILMIAFCVLLAWITLRNAIEATALGERLELAKGAIVLWPVHWIVPAGFVAMAFASLVKLADALEERAHSGRKV